MAITRAQQVRQMLKDGNFVMQGGVKNYLGKQKTVSNVPLKWQSGPDKPATELAYITKAEKDLLLKKDIHGSLKDGPNTGPEGIMSLDSQGDRGTYGDTGQSYGDRQTSDTSPEVGDRGGGYQERGDPGYQETIKKIREAAKKEDARQKARKDAEKKRQEEISKQRAIEFKAAQKKAAKQKAAEQKAAKKKKFDLFALSNLTRKGLYNIFPNNPDTELAFLSGLTQEQVDALDNKELSGLYDAIQEADFAGDLSFEDALGDKYGKLSFDAFDALSKRGIDTNFQDPQGEFGNMDFAEYAARIKGKPGLLFSGNVGNIQTIKNPDGTFSFVERPDDRGPGAGNNPILPILPTKPQTPTIPIVDPTLFRFFNRGGMVEDAPVGTGIMDLEAARQMMFIGGIAKGIKKGLKGVTRAAKKVFKSPFGKAALLAAPFVMGGGGGALGKFFGKGSFSPFKALIGQGTADMGFGPSGLGRLLGDKFVDQVTGKLTAGGVGGLFGLATLLSSLQKPKEDDFDIDEYYRTQGLSDFIASLGQRNRFLAEGGKAEPVAKKTMPLLDLDGQEMDFRAEGGFVPIGRMEKADDVPARLSKNEFVFTAEAVRNAGDGDVDKGAEVMYNTMKNLEAGGTMSEESQGLEGAREMFKTSQRLGEVI